MELRNKAQLFWWIYTISDIADFWCYCFINDSTGCRERQHIVDTIRYSIQSSNCHLPIIYALPYRDTLQS